MGPSNGCSHLLPSATGYGRDDRNGAFLTAEVTGVERQLTIPMADIGAALLEICSRRGYDDVSALRLRLAFS
jgi:hypothetical protein